MSEERDAMFGPGTDLVVSLFATALILFSVVAGLYLVSAAKLDAANVNIRELSESNRDKDALIGDNNTLIKRIQALMVNLRALNKRDLEVTRELEDAEKANRWYKRKFDLLDRQLQSAIAQKKNLQNEVVYAATERQRLDDRLARAREKAESLEHHLDLRKRKLKKIQAENAALQAELKGVSRLHQKANKRLASLETTRRLREGHDNTPVPKRSTAGKQVYRVYAKGSPGNVRLFYKPHNGERRIPASRSQIHRVLAAAKRVHGSDLYVAVNVPDHFSVIAKKKLQCEFWKYDYYEYFDKSYCSGM